MGRLILHIGAHKTATSYIQEVLTLNDALLEEHGVIYPRLYSNKAHHVLTAPWRPDITKRTGFTAEDAYAAHKKLVDDHGKSDRTVVLSAEPWSRTFTGVTDYTELARMVEGFDEVVILYVMRHQWELMQSLYLQFTTDWPKPLTVAEALDAALQGNPLGGVSINHKEVLDLVLTGFDESQINFASYEAIKGLPNGVLTPILDLCGMSEFPEGWQEAPPANVSADPLATHVAQLMQPRQQPNRSTIRRVRRAIDVAFGEDAKTTILNRDEAEALDDFYRAANDEIYERLQKSSPYITRQPLKFSDKLIQRHQIDMDFMVLLARRLNAAASKKEEEMRAAQAG